MDFSIGIEIELIANKQLFMEQLKAQKIDYLEVKPPLKNNSAQLVIKPETTLKDPLGFEINFPPSYTFEDIEKVLNILNRFDIKFNDRCAMHIHISFHDINLELIKKIYNYYLEVQSSILADARKADLYAGLNEFSNKTNQKIRRNNLNTISAFKRHKTIEHRIYKSTIDFDKII